MMSGSGAKGQSPSLVGGQTAVPQRYTGLNPQAGFRLPSGPLTQNPQMPGMPTGPSAAPRYGTAPMHAMQGLGRGMGGQQMPAGGLSGMGMPGMNPGMSLNSLSGLATLPPGTSMPGARGPMSGMSIPQYNVPSAAGRGMGAALPRGFGSTGSMDSGVMQTSTSPVSPLSPVRGMPPMPAYQPSSSEIMALLSKGGQMPKLPGSMDAKQSDGSTLEDAELSALTSRMSGMWPQQPQQPGDLSPRYTGDATTAALTKELLQQQAAAAAAAASRQDTILASMQAQHQPPGFPQASSTSSLPMRARSISPDRPQQKAPSGSVSSAMPDKHGLLGLLNVIRMTDKDLNMLTLGFDLTTLGLNLNSSNYLYSTFATPWSEGPTWVQPEFRLPACYNLQAPVLKAGHFSKLALETLFYIFYSMPRDVLQAAAAQELYNRDWRYHKEMKLWFTRMPNVEPSIKTPTYERGSYIFFDHTKWERVPKENFIVAYDQIEQAGSK